MRTFFLALRVNPAAEFSQSLHTSDCILGLVRFEALQLVNVEASVVCFRKECNSIARFLTTRRVQPESREIVQGAKPNRSICGHRVVGILVRHGHVLNARSCHFEALTNDMGIRFVLGAYECRNVHGLDTLLPIIAYTKAIVRIGLNVSQECKHNTLIVSRAIVQDSEDVGIGSIWAGSRVPRYGLDRLDGVVHKDSRLRSATL